MELFKRIVEIIDANLIFCLCPLILSLLLIELLFKNKFKTKKALNVVRWIIISYTAITLVCFIIGMIISSEEFAFTNRATGPYWIMYWIMLLSATLLPFSLLIKKLGSKFVYVFLIAFFMKSGLYFERFVIIVTSLHRDYLPMGQNSDWPGFPIIIAMMFLQGFLLAVLLLCCIGIAERIKLRTFYEHSSQ